MTAHTGKAACVLHHQQTGTGPNLLLISGLNGQARFWDAVAGPLSQSFTTLTFDQRGCGATPDDGAAWSIRSLAADAIALADEVFGAAPFVVVGHSTGGAIAQHMAAAWPERVTAAVFSGTWLRADEYMKALFALRQSLLARAPDLDPILSNMLRMPPDDFHPPAPHIMPAVSVTRRRMEALIAHDGKPLAPQITCPALVIGAEDDRIIPPHLQRELRDALSSATIALLASGGHFFPQTRSETFVAWVTEWLERSV